MKHTVFGAEDITHSDVRESKVILIREYSNGCYYLELFFPDGSKKSVGVELPVHLQDIMEHLGIRKCLFCSVVDSTDHMKCHTLRDGSVVHVCESCSNKMFTR